MYLFFDSETSALPADFYAPPSKGPNWPRLVTLAWVVTDGSGVELGSAHHLIRPDGWTIGAEAERIHGISTERALRDGVPLPPVLERFRRLVVDCSVIIAHNAAFDSGVIASEYLRLGQVDHLARKAVCCTMLRSVDVCKLPGKRAGSYKWPRLVELHEHLFAAGFEKQHDALADVYACARCFFELRRRNLLADYGPVRPTEVAP